MKKYAVFIPMLLLIFACGTSEVEIIEVWDNGNTRVEIIWEQRSDSVYTRKEYYETGILQLVTAYKNGLKHGESKFYRASGSIALLNTFQQNVLNGKSAEYYANGREAWVCYLVNGICEGVITEYYDSGDKMKEMISASEPMKYINFWDVSGNQTLNKGEGYFFIYTVKTGGGSTIYRPHQKVFVADSVELRSEKL